MNFVLKFYGGSNLSFKIHDINMKEVFDPFQENINSTHPKISAEKSKIFKYKKAMSPKNLSTMQQSDGTDIFSERLCN